MKTTISRKKSYRSFEKARQWARAQNLTSKAEWLKLARSGGLPDDIPTNAWQIYKHQWKGVGDFLGNGYVATYKRNYRTFERARKWAHTQGLTSETQWRELTKKAGWLPSDIPVNVYNVYKPEWTSWGDFLGSGYVATHKRRYRSFAEARQWACAQDLKSYTDWKRRIREPGWLPGDIPADPRAKYGKDFTSYGDFFGTGNLAPSEYQWRPFHEAREWAHEQILDDVKAWKDLVKLYRATKQWPVDIPSNANRVYSSQWKGWEDFLGIPRMAKRSKIEERLRHELVRFLPIDLAVRRVPIPGATAKVVDMCAPSIRLIIEFDGNYWHRTKEAEARDSAKTKVLQKTGWTVVRIREHPLDLIGSKDMRVPKKRSAFQLALAVLKHLATLDYVTQEAVRQYAAGAQTVNGSKASKAIRTRWRPYAEARAWVQSLGIKSQAEWTKLTKQDGLIPDDIPKYPWEVYADEWTFLGEFLGTNRLATFNRTYRTFNQARDWALAKQLKSRTEWVRLAKQDGWLPADIPANVHNVYQQEWISWGDFLGTGNLCSRDYQWRSYISARNWARKQNLSTREAWRALYKSKAFPRDIPASPQCVYASEWISWGDFLGSTRKKIRVRE